MAGDAPDAFLGVIEDEQVVVETEPAVGQADVILGVGGKFFDEVLQVVAKIADGRTERK